MSNFANFAYGLAWFLVKRLPNKFTLVIFRKIADYAYKKDIKGVQQLRANLSFMLSLSKDSIELEKLVKEGMRSYLRYWQEAFRLPKWDKNYLEKNIRIKGKVNLDSAQRSGRPLVTAVAHMGNWDAAGFWYTNNFGQLTTVAERLKPESLFNRFVKFRNSFGVEIIPTSGETDIFMKLVRRAKEGRMIALVADRDISRNGIEINYGNSKTTFPVGPAAIVSTVDLAAALAAEKAARAADATAAAADKAAAVKLEQDKAAAAAITAAADLVKANAEIATLKANAVTAKAAADAAALTAAAELVKAKADATVAALAAKTASDKALADAVAAKDAEIAKLKADNTAALAAIKKSFNDLAKKWNAKNPKAKVTLVK